MIELLILLLPLNLGKHFVSVDAFVRARLIDYLVPTIWAQDLLVLGIIFLAFFRKWFSPSRKLLRLGLVFLAAFLPSVVIAENSTAAMYFFVRLVLYVLFALLVAGRFRRVSLEKYFSRFSIIFGVSVLLLAVLAIFQWRGQGSVFDNYLFFGEQPYDVSTFNVARASVSGQIKIPAYGTFRHPNTFAGFLAGALFFIWAALKLGFNSSPDQLQIGYFVPPDPRVRLKRRFLWVSFTAGLVALVLTFSQVGITALFLSVVFFLAIKHFGRVGVFLSLLATFVIFTTGLFLPTITTSHVEFSGDPSFYRRANLLKSSYEMFSEKSWFGVGLNNFTIALPDYLPLTQVLVFNQPVHNIFALIASESGIFAFLAFLAILIISALSALNNNFGYPAALFVLLLQFVILGSFDHYLYTAHQTQIFFWLTLGLALSYTDRDAQV